MERSSNRSKLVARFKREVRTQDQFGEENPELFLPVLAHDLDDDVPWFTMPLAEKNLRRVVKKARHKPDFPLEALSHILDSLEQLHDGHFVHRDLKPENVLLHDGRWKLADFGLILDRDDDFRTTSGDAVIGTPIYTAPENARTVRHATIASDIYAFGCILHDIVEGGDTRVPYATQRHAGPYGDIIEKCTAQDPKRRFPHVSALRETLLDVFSRTDDHFATTVTVAKMSKLATWGRGHATAFVRHFEGDAPDQPTQNLQQVTTELLDRVLELAPDEYRRLAIAACDIISANTFTWEFCDRLVTPLRHFFENSEDDVAVRAEVILAMAVLGDNHNRYFVMKRLLEFAGRALDDAVARRVAFEIKARDLKEQFRSCARQISRPVRSFHPTIADALE